MNTKICISKRLLLTVSSLFLFVVGIVLFSNYLTGKPTTVKTRAEAHKNFTVSTAYANVDMSQNAGMMLKENGEYLKSMQNTTSSFPGESSDNTIRTTTSGIKQDIYVIIGISKQVVKDHCDGSEGKRIIRTDTLRCVLVEDLAKKDLAKANEYFEATGKKYIFESFDEPWDQASAQQQGRCGQASGGQYLPPTSCSMGNTDGKQYIYIAILFVANISMSGGEAQDNSVRYVAPAVLDGIDHWESNQDKLYESNSSQTLTHELGHTLGQAHYLLLEKEDNKVAPLSFSWADLPLFNKTLYDSDLYAYKRTMTSFDWPLLISQNFIYPGISSGYSVKNYIPEKLVINLKDYYEMRKEEFREGNFIIFSSKFDYLKTIVTNDIVDRGYFSNGAIEISNPKESLKDKSILFIVFEIDNKLYYGFIHISEWNIAYFDHSEIIPITLKKIDDKKVFDDLKEKYFSTYTNLE